MANLLTIDDLCVSFFTPAGEVKALNGVSFGMNSGEVCGIVGESGSGKSVTASVVTGLLQYPGRVLSGDVNFDGKDVLSLSEKEMRAIRGKDVAMVFQDPMTSLNPVYSVGEQLRETIALHMGLNNSQAKEHAIHMLKLVGINNAEQRMKQYPHELSGGMRQRVLIAIALCCKPKLLIADEPTTALDVTIQAQILDLLKSLRHETGAAIVIITHDLGIVSDFCDKVVVMYAGRVIEQGNVDDIFYATAHPYTKGLLNCLPRLDSEENMPLEPIEGIPLDLLALPAGCPFAPRCKHTMNICMKQQPPTFEVSDDKNHTAECWLHTLEGGAGRT